MAEDVNKISEKDRAYFAGFFDGEGCVHIKKNKGNNHYILGVMFSNTYASVLYELKKLFGGNVYKADMEKRKNSQSIKSRTDITPENWKQLYQFHLL